MLRVLTNIAFTQNPTPDYPARKGNYIFTFCHEFEIESSWKNLSDKGKITLPKNVYVTDSTGKKVSLGGTNVNIGGFLNNTPLFLRGDNVIIQSGYGYFDKTGAEKFPMVTIFTGYISQVTGKKPFEIEVIDNMYILQQTQSPVKEWVGYTVEKMIAEMIKKAGLTFTVNTTTATSIGNFRTGNETIAQVLGRLRKEYNFESYFRGNELRCGSFTYLEADATTPYPTFTFQQDIISDSLDYQRKDDQVLSVVARNTFDEQSGGTTKDGHPKTKKVKLEALLTYQNGKTEPTVFIPKQGEAIPENTGGQRYTFHAYNALSLADLIKQAKNEYSKFYYTGFKGKFTTFGLPYVKHGDNIVLVDNILPERNGTYKVKGVKYTGGVGGLRQEIELHYKIK
jgi:hypothetical protein